jgi:hypothetical protein
MQCASPFCVTAQLTAESIIRDASRHARGPESKVTIGTGIMYVDERETDLEIIHGSSEGMEVVYATLSGRQSSVDAGSAGVAKWQIMRNEHSFRLFASIPSWGRGKQINSLMATMAGSEFPAFAALVSPWEKDYDLAFVEPNLESPVIKGVRLLLSPSPLNECVWHLTLQEGVYLLKSVVCEWENGTLIQRYEGYTKIQGENSFFAPTTIVVGDHTKIVFNKWRTEKVVAPLSDLFETNSIKFGTRDYSF